MKKLLIMVFTGMFFLGLISFAGREGTRTQEEINVASTNVECSQCGSFPKRNKVGGEYRETNQRSVPQTQEEIANIAPITGICPGTCGGFFHGHNVGDGGCRGTDEEGSSSWSAETPLTKLISKL